MENGSQLNGEKPVGNAGTEARGKAAAPRLASARAETVHSRIPKHLIADDRKGP